MSKKYSYILISLCLLGILLAPVTPVLQIHNTHDINLAVNINSVNAQAQAGDQPTTTTTPIDPTNPAKFKDKVPDCGIFGIGGKVSGCFAVILYYLFVVIPTWLLTLAARLFDFAVTLTLSDTIYRASFIEKIWHIVRDFSNIFFILILLYAAFQIILGLGHGGGKKMVASVLLVALLVNFSLFFTRVVVDSSNVLGLIFYNKIKVDQNINSMPTSDATKLHVQEKPVALVLVSNFSIDKIFNTNYLTSLESKGSGVNSTGLWIAAGGIVLSLFTFGLGALVTIGGAAIAGGGGAGQYDAGTAIGLMTIYGFLAISLAWAFLTVGISFISRLITLMILMIISPLAFVTVAVPKLRDRGTIGFNDWLKQLLETSFVAAIFMAILYIITEIIRANIFTSFSNDLTSLPSLQRILLLVVPALVVVIFLRKGADYAKKASGANTEHVITAQNLVGGVGWVVATGGLAVAGRATVGRFGSWAANNSRVKNFAARTVLGDTFQKAMKGLGSSSLDLRGAKVLGKGLSSTGLQGLDTFGKVREGGFAKIRADKVAARKKRADELEVSEDESLKQALNREEMALQGLLTESSHNIEQVEKQIKTWRERASDTGRAARTNPTGISSIRDPATGQFVNNQQAAVIAEGQLEQLKTQKNAIKNADGTNIQGARQTAAMYAQMAAAQPNNQAVQDLARNSAAVLVAHEAALNNNGRSINQMEDHVIPDAKHEVEHLSRNRKTRFANRIAGNRNKFTNWFYSGAQHSSAGADEARHQIIMDVKLDSGSKH